MDIRRTEATDAVKTLLVANDLPIDDIVGTVVELYEASDATRIIGVVGVQWLEGAALLRSLAVDASRRDSGLGHQLCDVVLREAAARGRDVWLLTTTAKDYFARQGFVVVPRDQVADAVRATSQFSTLCPSTAVVMRRDQ